MAQSPAETRLLKEQAEGGGHVLALFFLRIRDKRLRDGCSGFHTQWVNKSARAAVATGQPKGSCLDLPQEGAAGFLGWQLVINVAMVDTEDWDTRPRISH